MKIEINKLLQEKSFPFEFIVHNDELKDVEGKLDENGAVVKGTVKKLSKRSFEITMTIEMTMVFPCARCLEPTPVPCFYDYADTVSIDDDATELDLIPVVEECIYINEPFRILCREDCRGLCPKCGNNLNHEQCDCENDGDIDPRLAALKTLL
ncbi:DUF177 domain-containing protein [Eubacteriaceae bacterium ES3]|nr:DUF177 domain-containing protein [Eubacteriaceae bacterium ES3]